MRKQFSPKPWFYPLPVLMIGTYDENEVPDVMNAAWGGLYDEDQVILCLSAGHKTTKNILSTKAFTLSFATEETVIAADAAGMCSGNRIEDKPAFLGLHAKKAEAVNAPVFEEFPMSLECVFEKQTEDGNIIGRIVSISAEESILNENGAIDPARLKAISFDPIHNVYVPLGDPIDRAFFCGSALLKK